MKKFLMLMLAVFLIVPIVKAQAADIPNFKRVAGDSVTDGKRSNKTKGYHVYTYVPLEYNTSFAEQYVALLQKRGLTLIEHKETELKNEIDFWIVSYIDEWLFNYKNHQVIFSLFRRHGYENLTKVDMYFSVKVPDALTYEED